MKHLDIVIPCYNEESCVESIFFAIETALAGITELTFSVIYVDDGSKDKTLKVIKRLEKSKGSERVKYISFSRNFGKESAIFAGVSNSRGDAVVLMDADHQDPPSLLPEMLKGLEDGYDCVAAQRTDRKGEPPIRSWFANKFYRLMNKFSDVKMNPGARDYRMMTGQMRDALLQMPERERFSKGLFAWVGFKIKWLETSNIPRAAGVTKWSFWGLFKYAIDGIIAFTTAPLKIATMIGLFTVFTAVLYGIYRIIRWDIFLIDSVLIFLILFFSGIIITLLGVIGEYIARIYLEIKGRPIYIAKETNIINERNQV